MYPDMLLNQIEVVQGENDIIRYSGGAKFNDNIVNVSGTVNISHEVNEACRSNDNFNENSNTSEKNGNKDKDSAYSENIRTSTMNERKSIQKLRELIQLEKYKKVINDDGSVVVPKSPIFSELSTIIGNSEPLSAKNIYTILKLNRYGMHTFILNHYNINYVKEIPLDSTFDDSSAGILTFRVDISTIWKNLSIEKVQYNYKDRIMRSAYTLQRRTWTNYLFEEIYKTSKITCPLSFKNNRLSESSYALQVTAYCGECGCTFSGIVANQPVEDQPIIMECSLENYDPLFNHKKKRQLKGSKREEVGHELFEGKILPSIWRRKEANKLMKYGDKEPPHLFRLSTLRRAKQERQDKILGIKSQNVHDSLFNLKYDSSSEGAIRSIGLDPFYVHYFTNEQIAVYEEFHDSIAIDSTGSLVKKIKLPNGELGPHIFLYQCVTKLKNNVHVPIFQMISATQNTNAITHWLLEFLRIGSTHKQTFPLPKEITTDFSRALLGAIARSFAKKNTLAEYLTHCYKLLLGCESKNPTCFIRLDICHFMNMIAKWKCWKHNQKRVKQFYLRSIAMLREQNSLHGIEKYAKAIFVVSLNENQIDGNLTEQSKDFLTDSIKGVVVEEKYLEMEGEDDNFYADNEETNTDIFKWADKLFNNSENIVADQNETGDINPYFCPKVAENLKKLLPYFPLFSDVMISIFKYGTKRPTSAAVESEFNDLKNRVLQDVATLRADKFIIRHISSFPGKLKIGLANQNDKFDDNEKVESTTKFSENNQEKSNEDLSELKQEENWRNKNRKQKNYKYVDHMPEFDSKQEIITTLPVILNGTYSKNVKIENNTIVLINTCAFDSICQIFALALKNYKQYQASVKMEIPILRVALTLVNEDLRNNTFYTERAKLLCDLPIYNAKRGRANIIKIDGDINIGNLAVALFANSPSCVISSQCLKCNKKIPPRNNATIPANLQMLGQSFQKMEEAIINAFPPPKKCCRQTMMLNIDYGPQLLIETDLGEKKVTVLKTVPKIIQLKHKNYRLAGIVAYSGTFAINSTGHYTSYIPVNNYWIQYDDASAKSGKEHLDADTEVYAHLCIYVVN